MKIMMKQRGEEKKLKENKIEKSHTKNIKENKKAENGTLTQKKCGRIKDKQSTTSINPGAGLWRLN